MSTLLASDAPVAPATSAARPELVLKSSEFRKGREASWRDLEALVDRVERRGARALSLDELQRLPICCAIWRISRCAPFCASTVRASTHERASGISSRAICRRRCAPRAGIS
jgi:hypothetical protein